ncbi:MAG: Uma2 family endonuclease [Aphanocapsa lilacina HA4352-LM1]|jgi:Uma2 family endonuclease|nr:Uma2 family endonuclease [Aphanocapsa lilacina HA4352-LM1]
MTALILNLDALAPLSDKRFYELCRANRELRLERTSHGELIAMPPAGGKSGNRNFRLIGQLYAWVEYTGLGIGFDSSTGFVLANGAIRSPDAAWVSQESWEVLSSDEQEKFLPLCPDFVVELRSATDELKPLQMKMQEYLDNGVALGWLIDPQTRQVEIYRANGDVEILLAPTNLSGEAVLPEFVLDLQGILD